MSMAADDDGLSPETQAKIRDVWAALGRHEITAMEASMQVAELQGYGPANRDDIQRIRDLDKRLREAGGSDGDA
jgi:hypothetical protein